MKEELPKAYFYNQRGRKVIVNIDKKSDCIGRGFMKTSEDSPDYNPVYDKGKQVIINDGVNAPIPEIIVSDNEDIILKVIKI